MTRAKIARNRSVVQAFRAGAAMADIAGEHGITRQRVGQILRKAGIESAAGRCRLPAMQAAEQRQYVKLRAIIGAKAAREAMGIAP